MRETGENIDELLSAYCRGTISDDDLRVLKDWMEESSQHREEVSRYLRLSRQMEAFRLLEDIDTENALHTIMERVRKMKRRRRILYFQRAAAVAVLLLGLVFIVDWFANDRQTDDSLLSAPAIAPGRAQAMLVFEDGSQVNLEGIADSAIVRSNGTTIQKSRETIDYSEVSADKEVFNTIYIPRGGEYTLVLSDGTKVWLNADSKLTFPVQFVGKQRKITLVGEAYFEVAKDAEHPFIVEAKGSQVEVLGTSFNLRAYFDEKRVETTLVEGSVQLRSARDETVLLDPGQQGILGGDNSLEVKTVDTRLYTSWKNGMFTFKSLALEEIMKTFARWYDVEVEYEDAALKQLHFTGNMRRYQQINPHLALIALTTKVDFDIEGSKIIVKNK